MLAAVATGMALMAMGARGAQVRTWVSVNLALGVVVTALAVLRLP